MAVAHTDPKPQDFFHVQLCLLQTAHENWPMGLDGDCAGMVG